jgi:hypothetical protein
MYYHVSSRDLKVTNIALTSEVCTFAFVLLPIVGNYYAWYGASSNGTMLIQIFKKLWKWEYTNLHINIHHMVISLYMAGKQENNICG